VRQLAGAGQGIADRLAVRLGQPERLLGIREVGVGALQAVGLGQEGFEVLRRLPCG
jgi:hypothetical protein